MRRSSLKKNIWKNARKNIYKYYSSGVVKVRNAYIFIGMKQQYITNALSVKSCSEVSDCIHGREMRKIVTTSFCCVNYATTLSKYKGQQIVKNMLSISICELS